MLQVNNKYIPKRKSYAEIGQTISTLFAPAIIEKDQVLPLVTPFKCRDFFNEVLYAKQEDKTQQIYGFIFDHKLPLDKNNTILYIEFPGDDVWQTTAEQKYLLTDYEKLIGIRSTSFIETNKKNTVVLKADPLWQAKCFALSYYTFLIKTLGYKYKSPPDWKKELITMQVTESRWLKAATNHSVFRKHLKDLMNMKGEVSGFEEEYSGSVPVGVLHNNSGFMSVSRDVKSTNIYWKEVQRLAGKDK